MSSMECLIPIPEDSGGPSNVETENQLVSCRTRNNVRVIKVKEKKETSSSKGAAPPCDLGDDMSEDPIFSQHMPRLFVAIKEDDVHGISEILQRYPEQINERRFQGFLPLHYACHVKSILSLRKLLHLCAQVDALDSNGNTALHLAVSDSWLMGIDILLRNGSSPDILQRPPMGRTSETSETPLQVAIRESDLAACSYLLKYKRDKIKDSDFDTLRLAAKAGKFEIVNALLKRNPFRKMVTMRDDRSKTILHYALLEECDAVRETALVEIFKLFTDLGVDNDTANTCGETPLFLAAKLGVFELVKFLLAVSADPTIVNCEGQTLIHAACLSGSESCLSLLLSTGCLNEKVTEVDSFDREPFYYAVQSSSIDCCELLLKNGDHLTREVYKDTSRFSYILEHLPSAGQLLKRIFDSSIRLSDTNRYSPDFQIFFDYSTLLSSRDQDSQSSIVSELNTSQIEPLLQHPLLESFLHFKWLKIKKFFYVNIFVYVLYLIIHSLFIILTFGHFKVNWDDQQEILCFFIILHVSILIFILIPDIVFALTNFKAYRQYVETYIKLIALVSSVIVPFFWTKPVLYGIGMDLFIPSNGTNATDYQDDQSSFVRYLAAVSSLFCWVEFMMFLSHVPHLGAYVMIFKQVAKTIMKFTLVFSSLLIGFALSFMVLFHKSSIFKNFPLSIIKILMMMIGEIDYGDLYNDLQLPVVSLIFLVLFLFLACIVLTNLLIGLAVSDIPDLRRLGKTRRLAKQAEFLISYEKLVSAVGRISCFPNTIRLFMANHSKINPTESVYPNQTHKDNIYLSKGTIQKAIFLADSDASNKTFIDVEENDIALQLSLLSTRYSYDRKILNDLVERLNRMESKLMDIRLQIQLQENRNLYWNSDVRKVLYRWMNQNNWDLG